MFSTLGTRLRTKQLRSAFSRFGKTLREAIAKLRQDLARWAWVVLCTNLVFLASDLGLSSAPWSRWAERGLMPFAIAGGASNNLAQIPGGKIVREAIYVLQNRLSYGGLVTTKYDQEWNGYLPGQQITVKKQARFTVRRGSAAQVQAITQPTVVVTVQPEMGIDLAPTETDMALLLGNNVNEWMDQFEDAVLGQLASSVDAEIAKAIMLNGPNLVGTPGTKPRTLDDVLNVKKRLDQWGVPGSRKGIILDPLAHANLMGGLTGNFVTRIIDAAEMQGDLQDVPIAGFPGGVAMSQSAPARTVGVFGGAPVVGAGGQFGTTLLTTGWTAGSILNQGDVIHIAGMNFVNPQTRLSAGTLAQFCVTALATADAGGNMAISIYPAINPPIAGVAQQFQTVDSFPAAGAAITVDSGTSGGVFLEGAAFEERSVGLVTIPLFKPKDAHLSVVVEYMGLKFRVWVASDVANGRQIGRLEILPAFPVLEPLGTVRITS